MSVLNGCRRGWKATKASSAISDEDWHRDHRETKIDRLRIQRTDRSTRPDHPKHAKCDEVIRSRPIIKTEEDTDSCCVASCVWLSGRIRKSIEEGLNTEENKENENKTITRRKIKK